MGEGHKGECKGKNRSKDWFGRKLQPLKWARFSHLLMPWCFNEMPWLESGEAGGWLTWPFRMDSALGSLVGTVPNECRGPLGAGDCAGWTKAKWRCWPGTVHPWPQSKPVLLGSPLPSFPPGTKAQTRVWQCLPRQISSHEAGKNLSMAVSHQHGFPQPSQL